MKLTKSGAYIFILVLCLITGGFLTFCLIKGKDTTSSTNIKSEVVLTNSNESACQNSTLSNQNIKTDFSDTKLIFDANLNYNFLSSTDAGPLKKYDSLYYCYGHNEKGAIVAAADIIGSGDRANMETYWQFYLSNTVDDDIKDTYLTTVSMYQSLNKSDTVLTPIKYSIISYDNNNAYIAIELKQSNSNNTLNVFVQLIWESGDWKIYLPEDYSENGQKYPFHYQENINGQINSQWEFKTFFN